MTFPLLIKKKQLEVLQQKIPPPVENKWSDNIVTELFRIYIFGKYSHFSDNLGKVNTDLYLENFNRLLVDTGFHGPSKILDQTNQNLG